MTITTGQHPIVVQLSRSQDEAAEEKQARQEQASTDRRNVILAGVIAGATLGLLWVGWQQRRIYQATLATNQTIERAYITITESKEGLMILQGTAGTPSEPLDQLMLQITVMNMGNTPATITALDVFPYIAEGLPRNPPYRHNVNMEVPQTSFLVKGESFLSWPETLVPRAHRVRAGNTTWVLGYVDYIDKFGSRHRYGYARRFVQGRRPVNLEFERQVGYNYDRERQYGEGNDWGPEDGPGFRKRFKRLRRTVGRVVAGD